MAHARLATPKYRQLAGTPCYAINVFQRILNDIYLKTRIANTQAFWSLMSQILILRILKD